ncbi:hypothetical protein BDZ97DRAFT_1841631 [Flammula alnicola]|nr:hypothetical protein BDZ97DRAFT_1841631 [Flammula alnicola]
MVFGFFSRKPAPTAATTLIAETVEAGPSNPAPSTDLNPVIAPHFQFPAKQQQLHTPSPSIDDASVVISTNGQPLPKPKKPRAKPRPKPQPKEVSPVRSEIPPGPADSPSPPPDDALVTDPSALHALVASVPAQTLHAYTLAHLNPAPPSPFPLLSHITAPGPGAPPTPQMLTALTTFFASLAPPPKLHCVRCHRGYFDLENSDTACRVHHDDDSAVVERVGLGKGAGTEYETLWGCCGRTVDGDGDMGPPDGWCYEGAHTTDTKRARFRADSTPHDDKLTSCVRLRCHMPPRSSFSRASRKRNRRTMEVDGEDEDDVQSVASSHTRSHSRSISFSISSAKDKGKMKAMPDEEEDEESKARPAKRVRSRKPSTTSIRAAAKKDDEENADEEAMDMDGPQPPSPPKSPRRKPKSTAASTTTTGKAKPAPPSPKQQRSKPGSSGSTNAAPVQRSPLSASFVPDAIVVVRPESPTPRKPKGRVEVEILSRSPPKTGILSARTSVGSLRSLKAKTRTKPLGEIVDTSVDGEGQWS